MGNTQNTKKKIKNNSEENKEEKIYIDRDIYIPPLTDYKYFNRRMPYTTEQKEISDSEQKKLSELIPEKINLMNFPEIKYENNQKQKVIIDTDLGTDWDDAMAIMYALKIPYLEIIGITTNYGIPKLRANVVQKIIDAYLKQNPEKGKIPVIPGASRPLGTHRALMLYGHEGLPFFKSSILKKSIDMKYILNQEQENASKFIVDQIKKYPNEIKIISIGIPTNIGLAIKNNPEIIPLIKEIVIMGCGSAVKNYEKMDYNPITEIKNGNIISLYPNHNISGDSLATKIIFDSNIPIKIVSHTVSSKFWSEGNVIDFFRQKANEEKDKTNPETPEGAVGLLMEQWFGRRYQNGQCPHDPLTVNEAVFGGEDSPIIYARGWVVIHEWAAFGTFVPNNNGPHYLGVDVKKNNNFLDKLEKTIIGK